MVDWVTKTMTSAGARFRDASPNAIALLLLGVALAGALLVQRVIGRGEGARSSERKRGVRLALADWLELFSPALCGLLALCVFVGALWIGGFHDPKLGGSDLKFLDPPASAARAPDAADAGAETAARAIWIISLAAVILAALGVVWTVARIVLDTHRAILWRVVLVFAIILGVSIWLGPRGDRPPLGSPIAEEMLESMWTRNGLSHLGPLTDVLNAFGALLIPLLASMAFCLLLEPARPDTEIDGKALHHVAHRWKQLHVLLYVSTVVLMAGVIEVVALYSWSLAPFSGVSEVKVHADICKSSAQAGRPDLEPLSRMKFCLKLAEEVEAAKAVDGLRRVVRAHAVTFGAGFSALLVSLYAPSVLLLRSRFRRLLESRSHNGAGIDDAAMLKRYDLEMELPRRLVNALTTLGPLVVGILSGVITF